jgi:tight adherence protein C
VIPAIAAGAAGAVAVLAISDLASSLAKASPALSLGRSAARRLLVVTPVLGRLPGLRRITPPRDLRLRLAAAGRPGNLGPREWMALKVSAAAAVTVPSVTILVGGAGRLVALLALAGPVAGFVAPDFWLARATRVRSEAAVRELPDLLDLMRVSVGAGIAPIRAMGDVAAQFDGPLAAEWLRIAAAVSLGEPQSAAFRSLTERIASEEVRAFAEALQRSQRHGLPLGATLATHATRARDARRRRIREQAARAGPKMQLVVALVLVPSMLLVVAALLVSELQPTLGLT